MSLFGGAAKKREQALQVALSEFRDALPWDCADCGTDTRSEYFHVHRHVWSAAGADPRAMLCVGCLETRLGWRLNSSDFDDAPINDPAYPDPPRPKSTRLLDRLTRR